MAWEEGRKGRTKGKKKKRKIGCFTSSLTCESSQGSDRWRQGEGLKDEGGVLSSWDSKMRWGMVGREKGKKKSVLSPSFFFLSWFLIHFLFLTSECFLFIFLLCFQLKKILEGKKRRRTAEISWKNFFLFLFLFSFFLRPRSKNSTHCESKSLTYKIWLNYLGVNWNPGDLFLFFFSSFFFFFFFFSFFLFFFSQLDRHRRNGWS